MLGQLSNVHAIAFFLASITALCVSATARNQELRAGLTSRLAIAPGAAGNNGLCSSGENPAIANAMDSACASVDVGGAKEDTSACSSSGGIVTTFRCTGGRICLGGLCAASPEEIQSSQSNAQTVAPVGASFAGNAELRSGIPVQLSILPTEPGNNGRCDSTANPAVLDAAIHSCRSVGMPGVTELQSACLGSQIAVTFRCGLEPKCSVRDCSKKGASGPVARNPQ